MARIAESLRVVVRRTVPEALEAVRPGWHIIGYDLPDGRRTTFFCWVWPQPEHVHLGFVQGVLMDDPDHALEGAGITRRARWLTFRPGDPIDDEMVTRLMVEAVRIARMSPGERQARELFGERAQDGAPPGPEATGRPLDK